MAAFTSVVTEQKPKRAGRQFDTIGEVVTKSFKFTIPANTTATSTAVVGSVPGNMVVLGCYMKGDKASTANSTVALKTTTANLTFANATALTTSWAKITGANDTTVYTTADDTITATIGTATEANAVTCNVTMILASLDTEAAPYTTFTI